MDYARRGMTGIVMNPTDAKAKVRLRRIIHNCHRCTLRQSCNLPVPLTVAKRNVKFAVIGEAPGEDEDRDNQPFVGKSGRVIRSLFSRHRIDLNDYAIINAVCCRPPSNRTPSDVERYSCATNLHLQLDYARPDFVLLLGSTATKAIHPQLRVTNHHGIPFHRPISPSAYRYGLEPTFPQRWPIFVATYHPAAVWHTQHAKAVIADDIDYFLQLVNAANPYELWPDVCIKCKDSPAFIDPVDYLTYCERHFPQHLPYDAPLVPQPPMQQGSLL